MSGTDRSLLILHIGFAIFTLGPLTAATMSTPRYIRRGNVPVLRYLHRATQLYGVVSLGTFLFGMLLAKGNFAKVWLSASMTLFIVALVLLLIVVRDQATAIRALENAAMAKPGTPAPEPEPEKPVTDAEAEEPTTPTPTPTPDTAKHDQTIAQVQRGRIAALSGVVALIWLVVLVLMVWH